MQAAGWYMKDGQWYDSYRRPHGGLESAWKDFESAIKSPKDN